MKVGLLISHMYLLIFFILLLPVAGKSQETAKQDSGKLTSRATGYLALEYSLPDLAYVDSVQISSVQKLPDLTGRIDYKVKKGFPTR